MSVHAYHPGTGHAVVVDEEALDHMRASGWMLLSEHEANLAEQAAREQAAQAAQAGGKPAKITQEK
jgi:hypothetical protein